MSTEAAAAGGGNLLDAIMTETNMAPADEGYGLARRGVEALVESSLRARPTPRSTRA